MARVDRCLVGSDSGARSGCGELMLHLLDRQRFGLEGTWTVCHEVEES